MANNSTAPINISRLQIKDKCMNKCQYNFKYNNSKCIIKNNKNHLQLSYDKPTDSNPVTYNGITMYVSKAMIFSPSIHTFDGDYADAELIIEHRSDSSDIMLTCVPIVLDKLISTRSSKFLYKLVNYAHKYTYSQGEEVNLNLEQYNFDDFVPRSQFYAYKGTYFMYPYNGNYQYTVFHKNDTYLSITQDSLNKLRQIIRHPDVKIKVGPNLFLSEKGPNTGLAPGDEIYIECKPTGSDGSILEKRSKSSDASAEDEEYGRRLMAFIRSPAFIIPMFMFIFYCIFKLLKYASNKFKVKDFSKPEASGSSGSKGK